MSVYLLKPRFQALLRPWVNILANKHITANQVTIAACVLSVLVGCLVALGLAKGYLSVLVCVPVVLLLRMAMNAIDGMLAREHQQQTPLGAYLNELTDVISDAALYWPLVFLPNTHSFWVCLLIFQAALTELAGVLGQIHGNGRRYDGPMGKSDRALYLGLLSMIWLAFESCLQYVNVALVLLNLLLAYTVYHRVKKGLTPARI